MNFLYLDPRIKANTSFAMPLKKKMTSKKQWALVALGLSYAVRCVGC